MARGKRISDEIRANIIASLLQGQGVNDVAEEYQIPKQTVSNIKKAIKVDLGQAGTKKKDISELVYEYLDEGFKTAIAGLQEVRKPEYIQKQDIASYATHFGILSDKLFRILSAINPGDPE